MATSKPQKYAPISLKPNDSDELLSPNEAQNASEPLEPASGINVNNHRYPYCIVWTHLPMITSILPVIGHTGICTSEGVIHDFAGSHYISVDNFAFGDPHKYVLLDSEGIDPNKWDESVEKADRKFRGQAHNLFTNNCHSHVAEVLNQLNYKGKSNWNMVDIWWLIVKEGKYVSTSLLKKPPLTSHNSMNSTKSPNYLSRPQKSRLYTAPDDTFSYDLKPSTTKSPYINLRKPAHKTEYNGFPAKSNSVNTALNSQDTMVFNNNNDENTLMKSAQDDHLYYLREEDDEGLDETPSPTDKGKDKYVKRRQKNEKNYKDLNKSLANLALKRVINRSSSSDTNSWLSGQLQAHAEKSYNFEFQPYFFSPTLQIKNSLATTNHSNAGIGGSNSSYCSLAKTYLNSPAQISPRKTEKKITRSHHSPARPTSPFQPSIYRLDHESKMNKTQAASRDHSQGPVSSSNSIYCDLKIEEIAARYKNKSEKSWLDSNVKFFPGNLDKVDRAEPHRYKVPSRLNRDNMKASNLIKVHHDRSTDSIETALSYKDGKGMRDKSHVLDSKLPSKIDLNEKSASPKHSNEAYGIHERVQTLQNGYNSSGKKRFGGEDTINRRKETSATRRVQEEQSFEPIEKKTLDGWKSDLLKIKSDMESRKKHYNEVNKFFEFCEGADKRQKSHKNSGSRSSKSPTEGHKRNISIFSGSTYDSKSGKTVCVSPLSTTKSNFQQKSNKKSGKVSFDLALDEERPTAKLSGPQTRPNQIEHSAYFGSNKVQNANMQSFADPYIETRSKSPVSRNNQEQNCNIF